MKLARALGTLGLLSLVVIASPIAMADDSGWYGGFNVGQSRADIDDARITSSLLGTGFTTTSISEDDRDIGYKVFGGYQINRNFALEGGYFNLGEFGFTATTAAPLAGTLNGDIKIHGLNFDVVGILPIYENFSAFGRVGLNYAKTEDRFSGTGAIALTGDLNPSERAPNYKFGLGLQYNLTESLGVRAEAERYRIDDAVGNDGDVDLFSLGLVYRFGAKTSATAPRPAAPAPAATPARQPEAVTPPAPAPAPAPVEKEPRKDRN